jgi:hypothetical protein
MLAERRHECVPGRYLAPVSEPWDDALARLRAVVER